MLARFCMTSREDTAMRITEVRLTKKQQVEWEYIAHRRNSTLIRRKSCKSLNNSTVKVLLISILETGASHVPKDMCCMAGSFPMKKSPFHLTGAQGSISWEWMIFA